MCSIYTPQSVQQPTKIHAQTLLFGPIIECLIVSDECSGHLSANTFTHRRLHSFSRCSESSPTRHSSSCCTRLLAICDRHRPLALLRSVRNVPLLSYDSSKLTHYFYQKGYVLPRFVCLSVSLSVGRSARKLRTEFREIFERQRGQVFRREIGLVEKL